MKKIIATCALITCATIGAFAQNAKMVSTAPAPQGPLSPLSRPQVTTTQEQRSQQMAENQARAFERQYGLTPEQYKGVYAACMEFTTKMDASRTSNTQMTQQDFETLMSEKDAKFKKVMNAQQYAKYESTRTRPVPQPGAATHR